MNIFPRNERFQGHLIGSVPNRYVCSECHAQLIYAGDSQSEVVTCVKDSKHMGLVEIKDVALLDRPNSADLFTAIRNLPADSIVLQAYRAKVKKDVTALFGDDDA